MKRKEDKCKKNPENRDHLFILFVEGDHLDESGCIVGTDTQSSWANFSHFWCGKKSEIKFTPKIARRKTYEVCEES